MLIVPDNFDPWVIQPKQDDTPSADFRVSTQLIQNVEPLNNQIGIWPKKTVPAALEEAVLGGPWTYSYALVDAASHQSLVSRLDGRALLSSCLFEGAAAEQVAETAPWLVEIGQDDRLTRNLFTAVSGGAMPDAARCLFMRSDQPLRDVRRNLRKMTQVRDERERWLFFRFWDPLFARYLLSYGSNAFRLRMLRTGPVVTPGSDEGDFQIWSLPAEAADLIPRSPFRLEPEDLRALKLARLDDFVSRILAWLRSSYGGLPDGIEERRFALELTLHARERIGLRTERQISDYIAASWLLRMPVERRLDLRPISHEIPQATMERVHDMAYQIFKGTL